MTRKIDKRACRKFAMPELEFNLNEGVLHVESCPYIIRTAVRNIAGQRILMLYIYQRESILAGSIKPRWVMFHSRDDFATLSFREDAKAICRSSSIADESPFFALMNSSMKSFTFTTSHSVSQAQDRAMIGHGRSSIGDTERQRDLGKTHLSKDFRQKYVTLSLA